MRTEATSKAAMFAALLFALSVFCFTLFVWISFGGPVPMGAKGYRVSVQFGPEASNVFPNADVRMSGVSVGEVSKVTTRRGRIDTEMELDSRYSPLAQDAKAIVRSKTLLGEAYIELTPGSGKARVLPEGGRLSQANVEEAQGLDRALSAFDKRTREDLRRFMQGVGEAFEGRGPDASATLGNAGLALEDLRKLVDVLDRQGDAVRGLVRDTGSTLETIAERGADAQTIARAGAKVFDTTASRDRQLTETIRLTPALLKSIRSVASKTAEVSVVAAPALRNLRPVAPLVEPGLLEAKRLAPDLESTLKALGKSADASEKGLPALTAILQAARPLLKILDPAGQQLVPVVKTINAYRSELTYAMANTASALNATVPRPDGSEQHYLRALTVFNNESGFGADERYGTHRENPYPAPGALRAMLNGGTLNAIDCREVGHATPLPPTGSGAAPCLLAEPYSVDGSPAKRYPNVLTDESK